MKMKMTPVPGESSFGALETSTVLTPDQIEAKARELLAHLSLEEKLGLMDGDPPSGAAWSIWRGEATIGTSRWLALCRAWASPAFASATGRAAWSCPAPPPSRWRWRGASWDVELQERIGDAIGRELRAL